MGTLQESANPSTSRRTDWDYAVLAGWIAPQTTTWMPVGRCREVKVPLYRTADVDALLDVPGVDWHAVRTCGKGDLSPLREIVGSRPPSRAEVVRRWIAEFGDRHGIDVWAIYRPGPDRWELNWEMPGGRPTKAEVAAAMAADPMIGQYVDVLELSTEAGAATRWARDKPGAAVVLDTETTDLYGAVVEIAVIDACTGRTSWTPWSIPATCPSRPAPTPCTASPPTSWTTRPAGTRSSLASAR